MMAPVAGALQALDGGLERVDTVGHAERFHGSALTTVNTPRTCTVRSRWQPHGRYQQSSDGSRLIGSGSPDADGRPKSRSMMCITVSMR
jgi:hypothetical protein